jgi:hypothetical protein
MKTNIIVEVNFETIFDADEMPTSYTEPDYLEEVIKEAVEDAMTDLGAKDTKGIHIAIEGLE